MPKMVFPSAYTFNPGNAGDNLMTGSAISYSAPAGTDVALRTVIKALHSGTSTGFHLRIYKDGVNLTTAGMANCIAGTTGRVVWVNEGEDDNADGNPHTYDIRLAGAGSTTPNVAIEVVSFTAFVKQN